MCSPRPVLDVDVPDEDNDGLEAAAVGENHAVDVSDDNGDRIVLRHSKIARGQQQVWLRRSSRLAPAASEISQQRTCSGSSGKSQQQQQFVAADLPQQQYRNVHQRRKRLQQQRQRSAMTAKRNPCGSFAPWGKCATPGRCAKYKKANIYRGMTTTASLYG